MSHNADRRVGQKLYFAHIHLRELEKLAELAPAGALSRQMAYTESFAFHLKGALNCYLAELASHYKVDTSPEQSLEPMLLLLAHRGAVSPELNELHALAAVHDSWVTRLDAFYRACNEGSGVRIESARSLSDLSDRSEPSGKARTDLTDFEKHSGLYVTKNRSNMDRYPAGVVDQPQVRQAPRNDSGQHLPIIDLQGSGEAEIILPDVIECARWLAAAEELIERQRQGMEQW